MPQVPARSKKTEDGRRVAAIIGGVARVATRSELLVEGAGFGFDVDYELTGKSLVVRLGQGVDKKELGTWITTLARRVGSTEKLNEKDPSFTSHGQWPVTMCKVLNGVLADAPCREHGLAFAVQGLPAVLAVTSMLFGNRGMESVAGYFRIPLSSGNRKRM